MSDSEQQYPYPHDQGYGQPYPPEGQRYDQQGQSYPPEGQPYDQGYGQPYPPEGQPYDQQGQPYDQGYGQPYPPEGQPYDQQGQPYTPQGPRYGGGDGAAVPYGTHASSYPGAPGAVVWPEGHDRRQPAPHAHEDQAHQGHAEGGPVQGAPDAGATQTWQGQTWDTQYQPTIQPQPQQAAYRPVDEQQATHPPVHEPQQAAHRPMGEPLPQAGPRHAGYRPASRPGPPESGAPAAYPLPPEAAQAPDALRVPAASAAGPGAPAPTGGPADDSGYSAPTTLGNSRITDAQRARAEGRSPIIAPGMQPAAVTAGLGLLLALGAAVGPYALLVPLVLLQAVTAAGWFRLNGMWPARQGIALAFAGGFVADVVLLVAGRDNGPAAILGTLGVWVLLTLVLQLRSHAGADERMYGLTATVASSALAVLAVGHLAAVPDAVTVGGVAVAVAVLVRALPLPGPASVGLALLVSAGAGALAGGFTDFGAQGAFLGAAAGCCALIGLRVASYDYPSRFVHMTAGVALPLTAAAPAVYLIGRALA
ncbi:hypothetical protein ABZ371_08625 [Streptomyces sp. NPDC005899]|uniref:hypothetical protein n=1 Tax=Streptomyces sp. NPDC005899 TaxID=3155716 RepID=UPI0033EF4813